MQTGWQLRNSWNSDRDAAYAEAVRRIDQCIERQEERLYLGDVKLDRLPLAISSLTWLNDLDLYGSPLTDFTLLSGLVNLRTLKAGSLNSPAPALSFLGKWHELRELRLISTTSLDLAPLQSCQQLTRLDVSCSQHPVELRNLDALDRLPFLKHVSFLNLQAKQFNTIGTWLRLEFLQLLDANLSDLSGFDQLSNLKYLDIRGALVNDLSPLSYLPHLHQLKVAATNVRDLAPLASVRSLEDLTIAGAPVCTLRPLTDLAFVQSDLQECRGLQRIDLSECPINDLAPLSGFTQLEHVDLSGTPVTTIEPLHGIKTLQSVILDRTTVRTLGPRGTMSALATLSASDTPLEDIRALEPARSLQSINISDTLVADLNPLRDAIDCRTLILRGSQVADLAPLIGTGSREEDHRYSRQLLDFRDTPAAQANKRLTALAALADTDRQKCFAELKEYLRAQAVYSRTGLSQSLRQLLGIKRAD